MDKEKIQSEIDFNNVTKQKNIMEKAKMQAEYKAALQDQKSDFNRAKMMNELN